jgi:hypothetical protein
VVLRLSRKIENVRVLSICNGRVPAIVTPVMQGKKVKQPHMESGGYCIEVGLQVTRGGCLPIYMDLFWAVVPAHMARALMSSPWTIYSNGS